MNTSFSSGMQFAWDSTSLKLASTCLRKYEYKMIQNWTSLAPSAHLLAQPRACIFAQVSLSVTVRLKTGAPGFESGSAEK